MYQEFADIFWKISVYVRIIRQFKEDINEVHLKNEIEDSFGRNYCRIYVNINLKENSNNKYALYQAINDNFKYGEKEYFSFYLGKDGYNYDNESDKFLNKEEEVHYNYIWNLLEWFLKEDNIRISAASFIRESQVRNEEKIRQEQIEEKWNKIEAAVQNLAPQTGQFIAIKQWKNSPIRIGIVTKVTLPSRRHSFSLELSELKKDLMPGKVIINHLSQRDIYAIIQPESLLRGKTKTDLISQIEKNELFEGLIWRRPQDLWD